ncbi:hypothetical protein IAT38_001042 [Cryptococcus sp. DSM 104549]
MPTLTTLIPLLSLLLLLGTSAQQPGSFTFNTSSTSSSCILISQLTLSDASSPPVLQAIAPLCTSSTPFPTLPPAPGDNNLTWPLSQDGTAAASGMAIYADITEQGEGDGEGAKAGCVMQLSVDQVQYLLGRSLTWNAGEKELWDNTDSGFVMNGTTDGALVCNEKSTLLPDSLVFPNPFKTNATDGIWWTTLTVGDVAAGTAVAEADSEPAATSAGAEAVATGGSSAEGSGTAEGSAATDSAASTGSAAAAATGTDSATESATGSTAESTAVASTTSSQAEAGATSASDATEVATTEEATSTGGDVVALATGTEETSNGASTTGSETASQSASTSATSSTSESAAATATSESGSPADDPIGVDSTSGAASSDEAVSATSDSASTAATSTDTSSSDAATITTGPSTAGSATVAAVATSASGDSGQCVPVTITEVQTVTAGGGERRWWMGREYD